MSRKRSKGFTLAELLIALAILGVIATFAIPKVLQSQQDERFNAVAKEAAASIAQAYNILKLNGQVNANTKMADLVAALNHVTVITDGTYIDRAPGGASYSCTAVAPCYRLHNGALLYYDDADFFNGTTSLHALYFIIDPDGVYSGSTTGPGKSIRFFIYYTGRLATFGTISPGTTNNNGPYTPTPANDPSWFHW